MINSTLGTKEWVIVENAEFYKEDEIDRYIEIRGKKVMYTGIDGKTPVEPLFRFACGDMETGEVLCQSHRDEENGRLPDWFNDPLIRAIKLAQWKKKQENKIKKGHKRIWKKTKD